ncbi:MAG: thioredoxin family protein [Bacilli bacterium]|jgi:small redox-active disulfide protein 2|nr:thioredoxin family protein [Bacilli bacterium]
MKIQALGCGCPKSVKNYEAVVEAAKEMGLKDEVEFYQDSNGIIEMGIMSTPALVIDGKVYSMGRVLDVKQAKELLKRAQESRGCSCGCPKR